MNDRLRVLAGRYQLLAELGAGAMGTVYRARDRRTGRIVAVKVLHPYLSSNQQYTERFRREAQLSVEVDSRHTVQTLASGQDDRTHFLVMEFMAGGSLETRVAVAHAAPRMRFSSTRRVQLQ